MCCNVVLTIQFHAFKSVQVSEDGDRRSSDTEEKRFSSHLQFLCMEPHRARSGQILPCFHTFCLSCLTALQDSVTTATPERRLEEENRPTENEEQKQPDSNRDEGKKQDKTSEGNDVTNDRNDDVEKSVLLCPTCRAPVPIPEGGVAALQVWYLTYLEKN